MERPLRTVQSKLRTGFSYADYAAGEMVGGIVLDNGLMENDIIVAYPLTNEAATSIGRRNSCIRPSARDLESSGLIATFPAWRSMR